MGDFRVETIVLDLPPLAGALAGRLRAAGVPVTPERATIFARALSLTEPVARRRLYWTARSAFVTDRGQVPAFDRVFRDVFGSPVPETEVETAPPRDRRPAEGGDGPAEGGMPGGAHSPGDGEAVDDVPVPTALASSDEVLSEKRFDALEPGELAELYRLMSKLSIAPPERVTRRRERAPHGAAVDLRRTLRGSLRTGGEPVRLARRRRRVVRRRLVLLCDISGSMEPYARAHLQFLACAGRRAEAFVFATRLTRLTRALASRHPDRAIARAAETAPDWSSGTRIGDALKAFNDRHGRRGMARGAVVVILSDGWERGDPALVAREMERLARLAHRIVWVNPRAASPKFSPQVGGMAAALPFCDALVSGHSLTALYDVVDAIAGGGGVPVVEAEPDEEWASATPVAGSSVAMPSGYGPRRGLTTPGWGS